MQEVNIQDLLSLYPQQATQPAAPAVQPTTQPVAPPAQGSPNYNPSTISDTSVGNLGVARDPLTIPIKGPITQEFGNTAYSAANPQIYHGSGHNGVDIGVPTGTPIPDQVGGTVLQVGNMGNAAYGKYVVVQGADGVNRLYGHLSNQLVKPGQTITPQTLIGLSGATGDATGPHLHYSEFVSK